MEMTADQQQTVLDNLKYVYYLAGRYQHRGLDYDDVAGLAALELCLYVSKQQPLPYMAANVSRRVIREIRYSRGTIKQPYWVKTGTEVVSMETPLSEEQTLGDTLGVWDKEPVDVSEDMFFWLTAEEKDIITRYYLNGESLRSIGDGRGCSGENIRQKRDAALKRIRR